MRIAILSRNRKLYSTNRLLEAARASGHFVQVIDTMRAAVQLTLGYPFLRGNPHLPPVDAVIPRIGASITRYGLAVVQYYEKKGVLLTATSQAIAQSRDKFVSQELLARAGFPVPRTVLVREPGQYWAAINQVGGMPVVLKRLESTQGRGVMLVSGLAHARLVEAAMRRRQTSFLVQEFIPEADGKDIRVLVVGGRCVAAMERAAPFGDFRANLHRGGTARAVTLEPEWGRLALRAAAALNMAVAGIDIIVSQRGPLLLEANSSPGLQGIETATGFDVAGAIIRYLEQQASRQRTRRSAVSSSPNRG